MPWRSPESRVLTVGTGANNTALPRAAEPLHDCGVRAAYSSAPPILRPNPRNKAEKRCLPSASSPPTASTFSCREHGQGPLVVLCHGWPELSYSWRHQIPALADAGFPCRRTRHARAMARAARPPMSRPTASSTRSATWSALVQALGENKAVIVGHDWGAPVAWHAALFRPDIFTAVAGLSVPPPFRGRGRPLDTLRQSGITNFYWQYFQTPGVAEAEFERDVARPCAPCSGAAFPIPQPRCSSRKARAFSAIRGPIGRCRTGSARPTSPCFTEAYRKSGFRGGLNWYRNIDRNWELTAPWQDAQIHQPSLFIAGSKDAVITGLIGAKRVNELERVLPNLKHKLIIEGAGHWVQQERPDEVNAALIDFLREKPAGHDQAVEPVSRRRINRGRGRPGLRSDHAGRPARRMSQLSRPA